MTTELNNNEAANLVYWYRSLNSATFKFISTKCSPKFGSALEISYRSGRIKEGWIESQNSSKARVCR
jgi:hypothetical protein